MLLVEAPEQAFRRPPLHPQRPYMSVEIDWMSARAQESWSLLPHEEDSLMTSVAVGIAKLGEPPYVASHKAGAAFIATGRALSVAAGRLSFVYGLKVGTNPSC